jgi:hypothetical protein
LQPDRSAARSFATFFARLILAAALGCAHMARSAPANREVTLSRAGGLAGISETIVVSSVDGVDSGTWKRTIGGRSESGSIHLSNADFARTLQDLDSMARALPPSPPDTSVPRRVCADYIAIHFEVRAGESSRAVTEECPHRTSELELYWRHLHEVFDSLVKAAN